MAFNYSGLEAVNYSEGQGAVSAAPLVVVGDGFGFRPDATAGSASISQGFKSGDVLSFTNGLFITGSYDVSTGVLSITSTVNPFWLHWQEFFRTIRFTTTGNDPTGTRTLTYVTNNGSGDDAVGGVTSTVVGSAAAPHNPAAPTAVAGNARATITTAPVAGGYAPTSHTITTNPGGSTCTVSTASGSCTIDGLTNGQAYTFTDTAIRYDAFSSASVPSAAATPSAPGPETPANPSSTPATDTRVVSPPPMGTAATALSMRGPVCTGTTCITTGPVPAGATRVVQIATGGNSQMAQMALGARATARITTKCKITTKSTKRRFSCRVHLGAGKWTLTTQAKAGRTVIAQSKRHIRVRAITRAAGIG